MIRAPALSRLSLRPTLRSPPFPRSFTSPSSSSPSAAPSSSRRFLTYSALLSVGLLTGYTLGIILPRSRLVSLVFPAPTPHAPHAESREGKEWTGTLERKLQGLKHVRVIRELKIPVGKKTEQEEGEEEDGTSSMVTSLEQAAALEEGMTELVPAYTESRPYAASVPGPHSLSAHTLRGPGKFALPPLVFTSRDKKDAVFFMHLGAGLCGHEGVIHGGLLATVLDEALGRTAFFSLPSNIGVTATLEVKYKKPTFANQFVVVKTELVRVKGRKVWVKGRIEDLQGEVLVEAEALFVEPKMAKFLSNSSVREAMG